MQLLIALDGSANGAVVLEAVAPWLRQSGSSAVLLTVLDLHEVDALTADGPRAELYDHGDPSGGPLNVRAPQARTVEYRGQAIERAEREARERLEALAREYLAGAKYESRVVAAEKAAPAIIEAAFTGGADVIVLGTHGRTGFRRALLGSVAEEVSRTSPIPVFLVRAGMRDAKVGPLVAGR